MTRLRQFPSLSLSAGVFANLLLVFAGSLGVAAPQKVDINTATEAELAKVPGISQELAKLIVQYREEEGALDFKKFILARRAPPFAVIPASCCLPLQSLGSGG